MDMMKRILSRWKYIALVIGLSVLALMIIDLNDRLTEWRNLQIEEEKTSAEYESLLQTQSGYQTQIAFATSEAGVMEWAYRNGRWVREGEVLVVPVSPGDPVVEETPVPTATPTVAENWQLWLALFMDPQIP